MTKSKLIDSITKIETDNGFNATAFINQTKDELMVQYINLKSLVARVSGMSYLEVSKQYD